MTIYPGGPQDGIKYVATAPDGNRAAFNDPADPDYVGMAWFTGLDSPDIREAIDARAGTDGSVQGLNFRGSRPVVGNVEIVATSTADRNIKFQKLKRAMNALRADGTLDFTPAGGGPGQRVFYRLNQPIRRSDERGWKYTVQFPLMAADPYIYSQDLHTQTVSASPWQGTIVNQGDGLSAPSVSVTVNALGNIAVSNLTTGESVSLNGVDPTNLVTFISKVGTPGTGSSQFSGPWGLAVDGSGNVYVADGPNNRVQKFNSSGVYQQTFGSGYGNGNGQLNNPIDVAVDGSGNVYVADQAFVSPGNGRVQKFNSAGVYQAKTTSGLGSVIGGQIRGVALDGAGNLFVADSSTSRIRKYTTALGAETANFGSGTLSFPTGVACDSSNQVWVADATTARFYKYSSAATPVLVSTYGTTGSGDGQFQHPAGLAIDSSNNVYVSDYSRNDIQKFNSSGVYQTRFGSFGAGDGQFNYPSLIEAKGTTLWVPDLNNNRIQQFSVASGSGTITLDFALRTVTTNNGLNLYSFLDVPNSEWWALGPGDNTIQVIGSAVTSFTVNWRDAWL